MAACDNCLGSDQVMNDVPMPGSINSDSVRNAIRRIVEEVLDERQHVMMGKVTVYDREKHLAYVKPMVKMVGNMGHELELAPIRCTVHRFSAHGYVIDMPLSEGDTGWIIAADTDTSNAKQSTDPEPPTDLRKNRYSFGFFIPDQFGEKPLHDEDLAGRLVIQTTDGSQRISMGAGDIQIKCGSITIESQGQIELSAKDKIIFNSSEMLNNAKQTNPTGYTGMLTPATIACVNDGLVTGIMPEPD